MRFFKSFSLLHRRSKSDTAVHNSSPKSNVNRWSLSLPLRIFEQAHDTNVFDTAVPLASPAASNPVLCCADQIKSLEVDNAQLNCTIKVLLAQISQLQGELMTARHDLHASIVREAYLNRQAKEDEDEIVRLEEKTARYTSFIDLMIDIGLHDNVLARACGALRAGEDADVALMDSIKEAAARYESPWSKIIPAVTGSRSPEEYVSAINTVLKVRRELRDCKKRAKFWKLAAKDNSEMHANTITPSVSTISSVHEVLSEERQAAVAALIARRKSGRYAFMDRRPQDLGIGLSYVSDRVVGALEIQSLSPVAEVDDDGQVTNSYTSTQNLSSSSIGKSKLGLERTLEPEDSETIRPYIPNLPPLASESFRQELVASGSYRSISKHIIASNSKPALRTPLGPVDTNRLRTSDSAVSQDLWRSAKVTGGRMAVLSRQSIQTIKEACHSTTPTEGLCLPNDNIPGPVSDPFIEALSTSLLLVQEERRQKPDPYRISTGLQPFENSAFENLISSSTSHDLDLSALKPSLHPSGTDQNLGGLGIDLSVHASSQRGEERCELCRSLDVPCDVHSRPQAVLETKVDDVIAPELSLIAEPIALAVSSTSLSPTKTVVGTPKDGTPVKKSLLPVLKRTPLFSPPSPTLKSPTLKTAVVIPRTAPLVIKKRNRGKENINVKPTARTKVDSAVSVTAAPSPASHIVSSSKQTSSTRSPSRLPALSRLLPTAALRNQTRWLFDN